MLRNYLITRLAEHDNDTVTVNVGGILVDVVEVTTDRGCLVLVLDPEDLESALSKVASSDRCTASAPPESA